MSRLKNSLCRQMLSLHAQSSDRVYPQGRRINVKLFTQTDKTLAFHVILFLSDVKENFNTNRLSVQSFRLVRHVEGAREDNIDCGMNIVSSVKKSTNVRNKMHRLNFCIQPWCPKHLPIQEFVSLMVIGFEVWRISCLALVCD